MERITYRIEETPVTGGWESYCPELTITAFGDTRDAARIALRRQVSDYLEDCAELGIMEQVLIDAGFYDNGAVWMSSRIEPPLPSLRFIGSPFDADAAPFDADDAPHRDSV